MSDLGNKKIFAKNLKYYMDLKNISRNEICDKLDIKYATFSDWINAKKYPRIDKIEQLANYFDILKSDLIENKLHNIILPLKVPILGRISAGKPIFVEENIEGYEYAPISAVKNGYKYFYLKVEGDSMNQKFSDGDLVLVQKQDTLENGEIGAIRVNGYAVTVKRFKKEGNLVILEPMSTNPQNTIQVYDTNKIEVVIVGKIVSYQGSV